MGHSLSHDGLEQGIYKYSSFVIHSKDLRSSRAPRVEEEKGGRGEIRLRGAVHGRRAIRGPYDSVCVRACDVLLVEWSSAQGSLTLCASIQCQSWTLPGTRLIFD